MKSIITIASSKYFLPTLELILFLTLCYFPLCYRIDTLSVRQWDEARNAVNAVEMLQNKNYIVRYYEHQPEVWEVKPPLLVWLQVLSFKAFGINELAIRFPIIFSTFLTVLLLIWYFHKYHKTRFIGYLAAMVLVTSQGYIDRHIARTGDHDALLILFLTAIILLFFRIITCDRPKPNQLIGIAILFTLGVLTKSVAAFFILPGLALSVFVFRSGKKLFLNRWFYIAFLLFLLITGGYYFTRELMQPGYLKAVWHWELLPRYANTENNFNSDTFWYYGINFLKSRFTYWIYFLFISFITLPFLLHGETRKFYYYLLISMVAFFIVISLGSKGLWYDGVLFPLFSITIALFLFYLYRFTTNHLLFNKTIILVVALVFAVVIYLTPAIAIMKKVSRAQDYPWDKECFSMAYWLRDKKNVDNLPGQVKVVYDGYNAHLLFYVEAINYCRQKEMLKMEGLAAVKPTDTLLISQESMLDSIANNFKFEVILAKDPVKLILIGDRRSN